MRNLTFKLTFALALWVIAQMTWAQPWPARPIHVLVGFAPGGATDILARKLAGPLGEVLGKPIVVENKTGASGMITAAELARAAADGHTIAMIISSSVSVPAIGRKLDFDPVLSIAPVVLVGQIPLVFAVAPKVPASTLAEFVALAKTKPGEFFFSSPGIGLSHHFAGELFKLRAGVDMTHAPYAGAAPAVAAVIGGQVAGTFAAVPTIAGALASGQVKALGVTGGTRVPRLREVPTIAESGYPNYEITEWYGVAAPAKTPSEIVDR
jgi:tripartite-type tricarboxylate transporter receptor subunit TctC